MFKIFIFLFCFINFLVVAVDVQKLSQIFKNSTPPFNYNMWITVIPGRDQNSDVIVFLHGYGSDYSIADILQSYGEIDEHLVAFNFPDYRILERNYEPSKSVFGTIDEILPVIYILKKLVIDAQVHKIALYGFSAGGGALINTLMVLNTNRFDKQLQQLGLDKTEKQEILEALQKGWILLDAPLKSVKEIQQAISQRRKDIISQRYLSNHFEPLENLQYLNGLKLNAIIYWEVPDEALGNRFDAVYAERFKKFNPHGKTIVLEGRTKGGHSGYHTMLWRRYNQEKTQE